MYTLSKYENASARTIKAMYFIIYVGFASWLTLFYVYLKDDCHLSGFQVGCIAAVQQINNIFFLPLWGMVADKYGKKKVFLLLLGLSVCFLLFFMIKGPFVYYLLFMIVFTAIYNPLPSLLDSIAIEMSKTSKTNISFGEIRLWASAGWALSSALTGLLVTEKNMQIIFPVATSFLIITWIIALKYLKQPVIKKTHSSLSIRTIFDLLNHDKRLLSLFVLILVFHIFNSPTLMLINLYYNEIGGTNSHIGLAFAIQSVFELPFFFWGQKIVDRFNAKRIIIFCMLVASFRMFLYGLTSHPVLAIAIGSLHGITLGLLAVALVDIIHSIVPQNQNSTGQSLMYVFMGIGTSLGNLINGYLKDSITLRNAMLLNSAFVLMLVFSILVYMKRKTQNQ